MQRLGGFYPNNYINDFNSGNANDIIELTEAQDTRFESPETVRHYYDVDMIGMVELNANYNSDSEINHYRMIRLIDALVFKINYDDNYHYIIKHDALTKGIMKYVGN